MESVSGLRNWLQVSSILSTTLFDAVFGRMIDRRYERACRRAMQDPRFQEIQQLIGQPDGSILLDSAEDCDLWEEQTQIFARINPAPWYLRLRRWWQRLPRKGF